MRRWTALLFASVFLLNHLSGMAPAVAEEDSFEFRSDNPAYAEADKALNEARMNLGSTASAAERAERLERLLGRFLDYPYRADLFYYLGVNSEMLGREAEAVAAYEAALREEPDLAYETPILSYLHALKGKAYAAVASRILIAALAVVLALAVFRLSRRDAEQVAWRRLSLPFLAALAAWVVLVPVLPMLFGAIRSGLADYPKPVLSNFRLGQMGDAPLRSLAVYGAGAILAALPVTAAASLLRRRGLRTALAAAGVFVAVVSILGLFYVRHAHGLCRYDPASGRLIYMVKSISTMTEVPDEMLPLYDENFRRRILESREGEGN